MRRYRIFTILFTMAFMLISCEQYLDKSPESDLSEEQIYSDYIRFKGVIDRITGLLHNPVYSSFDYGNEVGTYSDECQQAHSRWGYGRMVLDQVNTGNWLNSEAPGLAWRMRVGVGGDDQSAEFHFRKWRVEVPAESAAGIRACNLSIANVQLLSKFPDESFYAPEELRAQLLGQAYFHRAWFYFMIIRDFGGMPNMQTAYSTDAEFDVERPEYWESSAWVVQDLDSALKYLPEAWALPGDMGRATQTTAQAVKAMVLLYEASPNMTIPRGASLGFSGTPTYNLETLEKAAKTGVQALASALSANSRYRMYGADEYMDAFYVKRDGNQYISDESIFQAPNGDNGFGLWGFSGLQHGTGLYMPWFDGMYDWCGYAAPTQNAVDWYETADGWSVEDAEAMGADWDSQDPYTQRDPRLKKFIYCHGDKMYLTDEVDAYLFNLGLGLTLDAREGFGHNLVDNKQGMYFTGYYHAGKFRWPGNNKFDTEFDNSEYIQPWSFIRFAQLYLDLAEAANELYGPTGAIPNSGSIDVASAVEAINKVRERIGMPQVHSEYYDGGTEEFREYIRKERARELYFEQHRWQDLKRWRVAKDVMEKGIWVSNITDDGAGGISFGKKLSDYVRVFENRQYWYPFQESDMFLFENFAQNPGW